MNRRLGPMRRSGGTAPMGVVLEVSSWQDDDVPSFLEDKRSVGIEVGTEDGVVMVALIDSAAEVDKLIQGLLRHKRDCWPEAP
jgi:hypothetical protein